MDNNKVISFRGGFNENIEIVINDSEYVISTSIEDISNFNVRVIFKDQNKDIFFDENIFGKKIQSNELLYQGNIDSIFINNYNTDNLLITKKDNVTLSYNVYCDYPIHQYNVLNAIPLPTNILTIVLSYDDLGSNNLYKVSKYFDAFSHLGFCLVDFEKMKSIIDIEYGHRNLDLIEEFTNTELIDKLFEEGVIIITWGINPYTYPIYSIENTEELINFFGRSYDNQKGVYYINESINELSIIPGNALKNWEDTCKKEWDRILLFGNGKKVVLEPRKLVDALEDTTISSFLIYRTDSETEYSPLLNIDLLYS